MGKNHRHKKDIKAEKAKVKLKQSKTKFLPKGLNVTNTSFKIKPIVLPEQLKEKTDGAALSKRKLNAKDLLSRLKHYNENIRQDACEELTEMVKIHSEEIIEQHLAQVTLALSSLMQDKEVKVRKSAVKSVNTLLTCIPEEKLRPFFNYFSTNLRCAMTHINKNIQEDSLLFLDCFLETNSKLVSEIAEDLLPDFFTLISKFRSDSNPGRMLTVNLNSKLTSVVWRIKVLSRLHAILKMVLKSEENVNFKNSTEQNHIFDASSSNTFSIYCEQFGYSVNYNCFQPHEFNRDKNNSLNSGRDVLNRHIVTLIPLLHDTWLEVVPEKNTNTANTILADEAATMLSCIMNTMYLLYLFVIKYSNSEINVRNIFLSDSGRKFLNHLLRNFPYSQSGNRNKKFEKDKKNLKMLDTNNDAKCMQENLLICYIYSSVFVNYSKTTIKLEMSAISSYITKYLFSVNESNIKYLLELLKSCLGPNCISWQKFGLDIQGILDSTILLYCNGKLNETWKLELFSILSNIISINALNSLDKYQNWLSILPNMLCEPKISDIVVSSLLELSKKNDETFHVCLAKKIPQIIENLNNLEIITRERTDTETVKKNLINILFYSPTLSKNEDVIFNYIINNKTSTYASYLQQMLDLRKWLKNEGYHQI